MHVLRVLDAELREASSHSRRKASDSKPFQESMHPGYQARLRYFVRLAARGSGLQTIVIYWPIERFTEEATL
jgi:hypothetical protein